MLRELLQSKIHKATITGADLSYIGSITIDQDLLDRIDLWPGQKVTVVSNTSGHRLETYVIAGERNSGMICINGAAALLIKKGEEVIIFSYALSERPIKPKMILVDSSNKYVQDL
jgi:aspartate 1-decarboxylase